MTSRRDAIGLLVGALAAKPLDAIAQATEPLRIGFLSVARPELLNEEVEALRAGLRELGYVEGRNLAIEYRWADARYERLPQLADELVKTKIRMLLSQGTAATRAARRSTSSLPIVMLAVGDAVRTGIVKDLARPEANVTGFTYFNPELAAKRIELLKELNPRLRRVAVLMHPDNGLNDSTVKALSVEAKSLSIQIDYRYTRNSNDWAQIFAELAKRRSDAVSVNFPAFLARTDSIGSLALRHHLPSIGIKEYAASGGLLGYSANLSDLYRRAAVYVDKIVKGSKPADLPIEQPTKFEFVVNMRTAKALGIRIPQSILVRADRVIE